MISGAPVSPELGRSPVSCAGSAASAQPRTGHRPVLACVAAAGEAGPPQPVRRSSAEASQTTPTQTGAPRRTYVLDASLKYRPSHPDTFNELRGVDYPAPEIASATHGPGREAPGAAAAGLSQRHSLTDLPFRVPDCTRQKAQIEIWQGGTLVRIQRDSERPNHKTTKKRGAVLDFSAQSRRNMLTLLNQLLKEALPRFITLTLPGSTKIEPEALNQAFHLLRMAATRTFPNCSAVWKKELQDRKSGEFVGEVLPHFHLLAWGLPSHKFPYRRYVGRWVSITMRKGRWVERVWAMEEGQKVLKSQVEFEEGSVDRFSEWLSRMWYEYIGSGEFKHYAAGTKVEQIRVSQGVKRYAAKYLGKEQLGAENPYALGRYWGVWQKLKLPWATRVAFECTDKEAVSLMRVARKYFQRKTGRKSRLGHRIVKLFVNDWLQWQRLILCITARQ